MVWILEKIPRYLQSKKQKRELTIHEKMVGSDL